MIELKVNEQQLADLKTSLTSFSDVMRKRIVSQSLMAGAVLLANAIEEVTPTRKGRGEKKLGRHSVRTPGNLKYSIGAARKKRKVPVGNIIWLAGPMNTGKREGFYGVMVEKGHKIGRKKRYGIGMADYGGRRVPAHPFAVPAFTQNQQRIVDTVLKRMETLAADAAEKLKLGRIKGGPARL